LLANNDAAAGNSVAVSTVAKDRTGRRTKEQVVNDLLARQSLKVAAR
jgi:hypothetical protein